MTGTANLKLIRKIHLKMQVNEMAELAADETPLYLIPGKMDISQERADLLWGIVQQDVGLNPLFEG